MLLTSTDDFLRTVRKSGLVDEERIQSFLSRPNLPGQPLDLAKAMIAQDLITGFQAEQLLQGKSRGFNLGRFRILRRLGGGTTGSVFLCEHLVMQHRVAIKVLSRDWMEHEPTALARFRREARAASALEHPNIVRTLDLDEDDGRHYLVMEYVEGVALDVLLKHKKVLPIKETVGFIIQALQGLQHIHQCGMIHRDLKPGNLLLDQSGLVKILDLGLARFTDHRHENLTIQQGNLIIGTLDFMSPEQAAGQAQIDIRSDIYSLGATLYKLLTGVSPIPDGTPANKIISIQFHPPKPMRAYRPEVDQKLEAIVSKMIAKNPAMRYQEPKDAIVALSDWVRGLQAAPMMGAMNGLPDSPHRSLPVILPTQPIPDSVLKEFKEIRREADVADAKARRAARSSSQKSLILRLVLGSLIGLGIAPG